MIRHPAEFAARLRSLLRPPDPAGIRTTEDQGGDEMFFLIRRLIRWLKMRRNRRA
jgi:hypothetical protein